MKADQVFEPRMNKVYCLAMAAGRGWGNSAWRSAECIEKSKAYTDIYRVGGKLLALCSFVA